MAINWFYAPQEGYIPGRDTQLENLSVTQNGTYNPDPGKGFAQVTVNVEGGGGGSSDFSTAEVTFVNNSGNYLDYVILPHYTEELERSLGLVNLGNSGSATVTAILYNGVAECQIKDDVEVVVSGDAELIVGKGILIMVTGDCTITIS